MKYVVLAALVIFSGCAASKVTVQNKEALAFRSVAVLPTSYPGTVARERVDYLRSSLASQLRAEGYLVLDDSVTKRVCGGEPACPGRATLFDQHGVEALFSFVVDSYSESNFLAGYVHTLKGKVSMIGRDEKVLFEIEHATDDKGGLLFNSGQLVEAVSSQAKYGGSAGFSKVADEFIRTLSSKLPSPGASPKIDEEFGAGIMIADARAKEIKPAVFEICTSASPGLIGVFSTGANRTTLREIKSGEYCGIFRIEGIEPTRSPFVEIRSPYGEAARRDISLMSTSPCQIAGRVILKDGNQIELSCVSLTGAALPNECRENAITCTPQRFNTYAATSDVGPYRKVKEARTTTWSLPNASSDSIIEVLAIDARGVTSLPARATEKILNKG